MENIPAIAMRLDHLAQFCPRGKVYVQGAIIDIENAKSPYDIGRMIAYIDAVIAAEHVLTQALGYGVKK